MENINLESERKRKSWMYTCIYIILSALFCLIKLRGTSSLGPTDCCCAIYTVAIMLYSSSLAIHTLRALLRALKMTSLTQRLTSLQNERFFLLNLKALRASAVEKCARNFQCTLSLYQALCSWHLRKIYFTREIPLCKS